MGSTQFEPTDLDAYPAYPPGPFLAAAPLRIAGLDWRWVLIAADLVAAAALFLVARRRGFPELGVLAAAVYLLIPNIPVAYEFGWYEPLVAALLGVGLILVDRGWRLGYLVLGIALTSKQYGVVLALPLIKALWFHRLRFLFGLAAAFILILIPFIVWDADEFRRIVFEKHLDQGIRPDGLTAHTLLSNSFGLISDLGPVALGCIVLGIVWITRRTPTGRAVPAALWAAAALAIFFFFHSQAFFNYYYLCIYLLLLGIVASDGSDPRGRESLTCDPPAEQTQFAN
jgi:hypothetical protein